jgi:hypothetical protein
MIWLAIFGPSHYRKKQHARLASKQEPPPVPGWLILYWRLDHVDDRRSHSKHHNDRLPFFIIPGLVLLASPTLLYLFGHSATVLLRQSTSLGGLFLHLSSQSLALPAQRCCLTTLPSLRG